MGLSTHIVAAEEDDIAAVGESPRPLVEWSGVERHGIDTRMVAELHCLLTGDELDLALSGYEPVFVADEGACVLRLADELLERLAGIEEDQLDPLAEELAAIEEFEAQGWDVESAYDWLLELAELARLAEAQGQVMLVWMGPGPD